MTDFATLPAVSSTLCEVLRDAFAGIGAVAEVHDLQARPPTSPPRVTVFLYEVVEDFRTGQHPLVRPADRAGKGPELLILRYLVTAWGADRTIEQKMLGCVVRHFYDNPVVARAALQGSLAGSNQSLKIASAPRTLDEMTRLWQALGQPFRLSLSYEVRVGGG